MYGYVFNSPLNWHITDTGIGHADLDYVSVIPVLLFVLRLLLIRWISLRLSHVNFTPSWTASRTQAEPMAVVLVYDLSLRNKYIAWYYHGDRRNSQFLLLDIIFIRNHSIRNRSVKIVCVSKTVTQVVMLGNLENPKQLTRWIQKGIISKLKEKFSDQI